VAGELLLELLSEEIPARMQRRAIEEFVRHLGEWLRVHRIPATEPIRGYVTPRRLTAIANGIPEQLPESSEERRGPRLGAPQQAVDGFLRSVGLESIEQCEIRDTGRGEFYFAVIHRPGRAAAEVLPDLLYSTLMDVAWPKTMRFPASRLRWVRPLISAVCLFDGAIVKIPLDGIPVGRTTRGHRFLSQGEIAVENAADYLDRLEGAYVILDQDRRRDSIAADLDRLAQSEGLTVKPDPGLLDEVTGLVEFPVVLIGAIDDASMELPPEVLATAMRTHQKYFSCLNPEPAPAKAGGPLAPRFLFVANNLTADDGKTIVAGNERVLRARLADARFFWDQDRKLRLEDRVEALKDRVYYEKLGSVYDKTERMEKLAEFLVEYVPGSGKTRSRRAALLAKADLSTGMVGEFPELQGIMGRYYALHDGEDPRVADAIADHYKPLGPNDTCPTSVDSIAVALADKIDALAAFFAIDERPTGSRDPFALRRAALGIIRLVLENQLRLPLADAFGKAVNVLGLDYPGPIFELLDFIADRLKVHLRDRGVRHDLIAAVFITRAQAGMVRTSTYDSDLVRLLARVEALSKFLGTDDGANLLIAYRRASNIVAIEERRDDRRYDGDIEEKLLREGAEFALARNLSSASDGTQRSLDREEFEAAMGHLATLRRPVDEFFDKVTVNDPDPALRENRLRLLSRIRAVMNQVADFSQIEG
jgi:glycyl-tRNA synthetase beta chain